MGGELPAVIPVHQKDLAKLSLCLRGIRSKLAEVGEIHVVGAPTIADEVRALAARAGISGLRFVSERDHFRATGGWLLQQEIKLYATRFVDAAQYLVIDSDTFFLTPTVLRDGQGRLTCSRDLARGMYRDHRKNCHCFRYLPTMHHVFGLPQEIHDHCHIAHHAVFDADLLATMLAPVASEGLEHVFRRVHQSGASFSEFDTYGAFARLHAPEAHGDREARDDLWADIPWPLDMTDRQRSEYLGRYERAGCAFVSAHAYLDNYDSYEGCMAFADWFAEQLDDPAYRGGRWALQQWRRQRRSPADELVRELERALDARVRGLSSYCFVAPDGVSILYSEVLYSDASLAALSRDVESMRTFAEDWATLEGGAERSALAAHLQACEQLLHTQAGELLAQLPSCARQILHAWQALREQPGGRRVCAPLSSFGAEAVHAITRLLGEGRSDVAQLLGYTDELLPAATAEQLRRAWATA